MSDELRSVEVSGEFDLRHYASKYYDPAKAREYYLRTRELKGGSGSKEQLSKESRQKQAEAKAYVQEQVRNERTSAQKTAADQHTERLDKIRATATEIRDRIVENLKTLVEKLQADVEIEVPKPKLNTIPATATPRQKAFLEKQNARLTSDYNTRLSRAQNKAKKAASDAQEIAREEIRVVGSALKEAVNKARTDYNEARKTMAEKYSTDLKTELQNIEEQVR